jgi:hypothetical protein
MFRALLKTLTFRFAAGENKILLWNSPDNLSFSGSLFLDILGCLEEVAGNFENMWPSERQV